MSENEEDLHFDFNPLPYLRRIKPTFEYLRQKNADIDIFFTAANETGDKIRCFACHGENESIGTDRATRHMKGPVHIANVKKLTKSYTESEKQVALAQLKLVLLIIERNISFLFVDSLVPTMKECFPDSAILKDLKLCRRRAPRIVSCVIAPAWRSRLWDILSSQNFAIIVDESTDITVSKSLCIMVRFFDKELGKNLEVLWDLVKVYENEESCCNAEQTADRIISSFTDTNISLKNVVAFCSDTCNVMMGSNNSVATKLKEANPNIIIVKCACHMENLCAQHAITVIPEKYRKLISSLYSYINSNSSARLHRWFLGEGQCKSYTYFKTRVYQMAIALRMSS